MSFNKKELIPIAVSVLLIIHELTQILGAGHDGNTFSLLNFNDVKECIEKKIDE